MEFYNLLEQILDALRQHRRVTYRALKREFNLEDDYLQDLKDAILYGYPMVMDDPGQGLVWTGDPPSAPGTDLQHRETAPARLSVVLPAVLGLLQRQGRVTYRTLTEIFGGDASFLEELRQELIFTHIARDEQGKGLVWTGEAPPVPAEGRSDDAPVDEPAAPPERSTPEAERRQLSVMFCDLADSTALSQQLDPEDLRQVIRAYQQASAEIIQRFDGYIAQHLGDGLLLYFGWPVAHEDDARRALHAGLGIVEAITTRLNSRLQQEKGVRLTVRTGIHTGPVVVGEMGGGGRHENLATGETVNIASRLEGLAAPNTVVISQVTARLVRDAFALQDLGFHSLKGVAEPMQVFRVLDPLELHEDEITAVGAPFLVGRDEEIGLLMRRWEQSKEGLGQVVLVSGAAGIGKSSLVEVLRVRVKDEGLPRITFRCSSYHRNSALYPVIAHLERLLHVDRDDAPSTKLGKLEQILRTSSLPLHEVVPLLAVLLSVPLDDRYPDPTLPPQQQQQQTLDVLVAWMLEEAEKQPVLVTWEDLHWADPSTLELLGLLLEQTPTVPMLHVLTFRPEFAPPWPPRSHMTPIMLNRLERPQVEALIVHLTEGKALPAEVVEHIVIKTDGVPLYAEELTKMLLESELLQEEAAHYTLTGPLNTLTIPDTLQDSLMARLDQMNTAKEVVQLGAVLGREFTYELLQAISSQDDETLQAGLTRLVDAELLYQRGRLPRATYRFKHALIRDVAYESLLHSTRQQLHQQIAELFETRFVEIVDAQPEVLAHHYLEAGCGGQAVAYTLRAAEQSARRYANAEAITCYAQALTILDALPATEATGQQRVDLHLRLASLHVLLGHYSDSLPHFTQALALAEATEDTRAVAHLETRIGRVHYNMGNYTQAIASLERALTLSQDIQDTTRIAICYQSLGFVYFSCDRLPKVVECFMQALQISEAAANQEGMAVACTYLSNAHTRAGNLADAVQWGRRALALAERMQDDRRITWACIMLAQVYASTGEFAKARTVLDRALPLCDKVGDFLARAWVHTWYGAVRAAGEKDFEHALEHAQHVIRMGTESGGFSHEVSHQFARGAEYLLRLGRYQEAYDYCHQGLAISRPASNQLEYGYACMVLAEIYASEGYQDWDQAAWHLEESLKAFREVGAQIDVGRAHLAGARIAVRRQDGSAPQWAEQAKTIFAERGAAALLREVEDLLSGLT